MSSPSVFNKATSQWVHGPAIADPSGGTIIDAESRAAVTAILAVLRNAAVIAGAAHLTSGYQWNANTRRIVLGTAIAGPSGGATADAETRAAVGSVLTVLRNAGLIAGGTRGPVFVLDAGTHQWSTAAIADVAGGTTVDAACRTALNSALAAMRGAELIA